MNKGDLNRVAKLYGLSEKEFIRRHGGLLEVNLQAFRDAMSDSIMKKIVSQPENWTNQAKNLLQADLTPVGPVGVGEESSSSKENHHQQDGQ